MSARIAPARLLDHVGAELDLMAQRCMAIERAGLAALPVAADAPGASHAALMQLQQLDLLSQSLADLARLAYALAAQGAWRREMDASLIRSNLTLTSLADRLLGTDAGEGAGAGDFLL